MNLTMTLASKTLDVKHQSLPPWLSKPIYNKPYKPNLARPTIPLANLPRPTLHVPQNGNQSRPNKGRPGIKAQSNLRKHTGCELKCPQANTQKLLYFQRLLNHAVETGARTLVAPSFVRPNAELAQPANTLQQHGAIMPELCCSPLIPLSRRSPQQSQ